MHSVRSRSHRGHIAWNESFGYNRRNPIRDQGRYQRPEGQPVGITDEDVVVDHFLDQAHMSPLGSERFLQELGQWRDAQQ